MPSPETDKLRGKLVASASNKGIGKKAKTYPLPSSNDGVCEIVAEFEAQKSDSITMTLSNIKGEKVVMTYNSKTGDLSFDRRQSGIVDFSRDFPAVTYAPTHSKDGKICLRIFIDRSSIEVFEKEGKFAMTNLVFPNQPYSSLSISANGGVAKDSQSENLFDKYMTYWSSQVSIRRY